MGRFSFVIKKPPPPPVEPPDPDFGFDPGTYVPPDGDGVDFDFTP